METDNEKALEADSAKKRKTGKTALLRIVRLFAKIICGVLLYGRRQK